MNNTVDKMTPFIVMDVLERANELQKTGVDVIHLEVGEPDFDVPACVMDAVLKAQKEGLTHYTHSLGDPVLRAAISAFYKNEYNVIVDPECILVTSGSSPAILMVLMLLCNPDDEVIMSDPGYPCYKNFALACQARPVFTTLKPESGFSYDVEDIRSKVSPSTRAILVNSPMNPFGTLVDDNIYDELTRLGIPLISDEIYHGLVYGTKARSVLEFTDNAFVVSGFSKRFAMTGLRLGYLVAPRQYMRRLQILQQNLFICASSTAQKGGVAALEQAAPDVEKMRNIYNERRVYLIERLKNAGFRVMGEPRGAFYVFCDARMFTSNSYDFAFEMLEKAHVGVTPGIDFGVNGEGFLRFSYANCIENIRKAMDRIDHFLASRSSL